MIPPQLGLPDRPDKPRRIGRTAILDKGIGIQALEDLLGVSGTYVDLAKFGWGTAMVDPCLEDRISLLAAHDVDVCLGGTLFELCYLKGELDAYRRWLVDLGVNCVEISDGTLEMKPQEKLQIIRDFCSDFTVYSEVGSKDSTEIVAPARWVAAIQQELEAGSSYVILEGRESGTAGLYRASGEIRMGLIEEILDAGIDPDRLIFEAPNKASQTFMLKRLGPNANLGNIPVTDVLALETLRLGLRSDTLLPVHLE